MGEHLYQRCCIEQSRRVGDLREQVLESGWSDTHRVTN